MNTGGTIAESLIFSLNILFFIISLLVSIIVDFSPQSNHPSNLNVLKINPLSIIYSKASVN